MVAVLDQYEIEYKESYTSGTYDQVVIGKMFSKITRFGAKVFVVTGSRGVVYGSINSDQAPNPGTTAADWSNSVSYRLQPYREKAGNCRAAKHVCYDERIYDTLVPNPISCFKANGANVFSLIGRNPYTNPGYSIGAGNSVYTGVNIISAAFIMFDNYVPPESALSLDVADGTTVATTSRAMINPCVDVHWTKSFPFEPRYSSINRQRSITFDKVEATYYGSFYPDPGSSTVAGFTPVSALVGSARGPKSVLRTGLCVGTVGKSNLLRQNATGSVGSSPASGSFFHHWVADVDLSKPNSVNPFAAGSASSMSITGSASDKDLIKVIFGYGDSNTIFFDNQLTSNTDETGFARRGTHNWPEFRFDKATYYQNASGFGYEQATGSYWSISPIIRGWRYGLHSGLPDYTAAYYRQGRYGQFRDLLEQRPYTATINENVSIRLSTTPEGPVIVKFLDENENLTDPARTQSQNLSLLATSSLPYFDLQQRNRPSVNPLPNLTLVGFTVDSAGNVRI